MARTIDSITVTIANDSVEPGLMNRYIDRLLTECYELPGVVLETEIDVNPGTASTFAGCIDGKANEPEALSDELKELAERVLSEVREG